MSSISNVSDAVPRAVEPHRVVAGVDGSSNSVAALREAVAQARDRGAELDLVMVVPESASGAEVSRALTTLDAIVAGEYPRGVRVKIRRRVERGDPAPVLLRASADAELLVIGAHGSTRRLFGAMTVSQCVENVRCEIEVCGERRQAWAGATRYIRDRDK